MTFQVASGANSITLRPNSLFRSILTLMSQSLYRKWRRKKAWMLPRSSTTGSGKIWPSSRRLCRSGVLVCGVLVSRQQQAEPQRGSLAQNPRRTLMRPPVVKRQTPPRSGFLAFFSAWVEDKRSQPLATCSVFIAVYECTNVAAPNTYGGSLAAETTSAETTQWSRCDRETSRCPHTVLCKEEAQRVRLSSEGQARERGSPRKPVATIAVWAGARAGVQSTRRDQG